MADAHANFSYSTVATAPSPATSGTSLTVQAGDGTKFPTPPFNMVVCPAGTGPTAANAEIVRVTNRATDTFTITRTQEGTSARSIVLGDQCYSGFTAKSFTDIESLLLPGINISCRCYNNANISIPNGTLTALTFNTNRWDATGMHSTSSNTSRITFATAGVYYITANVTFASNATGGRTLELRLNGTTNIAQTANGINSTLVPTLSVSTLWKASVNDYVEATVYQDSGGALNVTSAASYSPEFSAALVGT